jgi:hypothetical protein
MCVIPRPTMIEIKTIAYSKALIDPHRKMR